MKETQTIYDSPRVKVVEIKAKRMLCASGDQVSGTLNGTLTQDELENW